MAKAAIFDVDGTLVDSVDLHARAWQDALADYGHTLELGIVRAQIGKGGDQLLPVFLSADEIDRFGPALEAHRGRIFNDRYITQVFAFADVRPLFQRLLADGWRIALASSAKQAELDIYKQLANIADLVQAETSSDDAAHSKPEPDIFVAALQRLGDVDPADVLVFGDTPYDAQAAAGAGLRTVGMLCGGWSADELRGAGCFAIYDDPASLLAGYATSPCAPAKAAA